MTRKTKWEGLRLVWVHAPVAAPARSAKRQKTIDEFIEQAQRRADKLDAHDEGKTHRGRRLSNSGAKAWLYRKVIDARMGSIVKVDRQAEQF